MKLTLFACICVVMIVGMQGQPEHCSQTSDCTQNHHVCHQGYVCVNHGCVCNNGKRQVACHNNHDCKCAHHEVPRCTDSNICVCEPHLPHQN